MLPLFIAIYLSSSIVAISHDLTPWARSKCSKLRRIQNDRWEALADFPFGPSLAKTAPPITKIYTLLAIVESTHTYSAKGVFSDAGALSLPIESLEKMSGPKYRAN